MNSDHKLILYLSPCFLSERFCYDYELLDFQYNNNRDFRLSGKSNFGCNQRKIGYLVYRKIIHIKRVHFVLGSSRKNIRFLGRWVGFQKSDITMLKESLQRVKIGDGWVGRSKNALKNRISFMDGPLACFSIYFYPFNKL